jgi:hypothetical protein
MSFVTAKEVLDDNCTKVLTVDKDTALWNLSMGLLRLTQALEVEIADLRKEVRALKPQKRRPSRAQP